jgi:hypothetical protein
LSYVLEYLDRINIHCPESYVDEDESYTLKDIIPSSFLYHSFLKANTKLVSQPRLIGMSQSPLHILGK